MNYIQNNFMSYQDADALLLDVTFNMILTFLVTEKGNKSIHHHQGKFQVYTREKQNNISYSL